MASPSRLIATEPDVGESGRFERVFTIVRAASRRQAAVGIGILVARVAGFLSGALAARAMGTAGFATYTVAFTVFSSLMQATSFADTWLVSRWDRALERETTARAVWSIKSRATAAAVALAALLGLTAPALIARIGLSWPLLALALATAGAGGLASAVGSVFQAQRRFGHYAGITAAAPILGLALTGLLAWRGVTAPSLYVVALAASYAPLALLAWRLMGRGAPDALLTREALRFGGWVTIGTLTYVLFQRVDVVLLASVRGAEDVGVYGAAARVAMVGGVFGSIVSAALMPHGSQASTWRDPIARRAYLHESLVSLGGMSVALAVAVVVAPWLITALFGAAYAAAAGPARLLLLGQLVLILQLPFYFALYALDGARWIAGIGVAQLMAALLGGWWLAHTWGPLGAALGNVATYVVGALGVAAFHLVLASRSGR